MYFDDPDKRAVDDDGGQKSCKDDRREHPGHQGLSPKALRTKKEGIGDRYESAAE